MATGYLLSKSLFLGLAGSSVGAMLSLAVAASRDRWFDSLSTSLCPSIGATIASELYREPPESRRFSIGLVPNPWGRLSTAATLHFRVSKESLTLALHDRTLNAP